MLRACFGVVEASSASMLRLRFKSGFGGVSLFAGQPGEGGGVLSCAGGGVRCPGEGGGVSLFAGGGVCRPGEGRGVLACAGGGVQCPGKGGGVSLFTGGGVCHPGEGGGTLPYMSQS